MTLNEAKDTFAVTFYRWARGDFAREIAEGCPFLRAIPSGTVWRLLDWMGSLSRDQQEQLAAALVKRYHPRAVELIGEKITSEEEAWTRRYFEATRVLSPRELPFRDAEIAGKSRCKVNRRKFATLVRRTLEAIAGRPLRKTEGGEWVCRTEIRGFTVDTRVDVGSRHFQLCYDHTISLGEQVYLQEGISVLGWLGITGQTTWGYLTEDEAPNAARTLAKLCSHFLGALSQLLSGERLSPSAEELESWWHDLASDAVAYQAIWKLAAFPNEAVLFLRDRILNWLRLGATSCVRPEPSARVAAEVALRERFSAAAEPPPGFFDIRQRVDPLFDRLRLSNAPADLISSALAVVVLEMIGSPEGKQVLQVFATRPAVTLLKEEAVISLANLERSP